MKVLMLSWEYPPQSVGGLAQHVYHLSGALARQGAEIHVITAGGSNTAPYEDRAGVKVHRITPYSLSAPDFRTWILHLNFSLLEYTVTLLNSLKNVDLLHVHDWLTAYAGRALKHAFRLPLVATVHATEYGRNAGLHNENQRYISDVEWWLTYEAWRIIVCSSYMERELQGFFQLPGDKITVIPNGVNVEDFTAGSKKKANFSGQANEKYIFFIGRLVREKGVQVLIDAAPRILAGFPEARFIIAGTGPYEGYLRAKTKERGLEHRICFTGYINDQVRNRFLEQSAVAVFPSLYEPFGIVALEAMAAGAPVVVSDTGGLPEIVNHGIDGLKCFAGSPDSLADNIMAVLGDSALAERLRENGSKKAKNQYSWFSIAGRTLNLYEEVIRQSRRSNWYTDTWMAADPVSALYAKLRNRAGLFSQPAN